MSHPGTISSTARGGGGQRRRQSARTERRVTLASAAKRSVDLGMARVIFKRRSRNSGAERRVGRGAAPEERRPEPSSRKTWSANSRACVACIARVARVGARARVVVRRKALCGTARDRNDQGENSHQTRTFHGIPWQQTTVATRGEEPATRSPPVALHLPGVKIGSLALMLPSPEPAGLMSWHCGPVASIEVEKTSGAPHASS